MNRKNPEYIIKMANRIIRRAGSRDPERIAEALGITILYVPFKTQKGAYKVIARNRYIFLKEDLSPVMRRIVLLHEIGHDILHRTEAALFQESSLFDMLSNRMEYEANLFAAQIMLPDDELIDYIEQGYPAEQIACIMNTDVNLVALKVRYLIQKGCPLRGIEHQNDFLK